MKQIEIKDKIINETSQIFIIAEAGVNHNGELSIAKSLVDIAVEAKADAVKFQTFKPDKMILRKTPKVKYMKDSDVDEENFYDLIKRLALKKEDFEIIKNYCDQNQIVFLSTPFDEPSVELLENLNISAYKISSGDLTNFPLLKLICSKQKPILLSTGMASIEEVKESVSFIKSHSVEDIVIFQCTSNYPTELDNINLNVIDMYRKEFPNNLIGFSDHSLGLIASIGAAAKGVKVIEKHITIDKKFKGPDHKASLNPNELKEWVRSIRDIEKALGTYNKFLLESEKENTKIIRKSIVTIRDIKKDAVLSSQDIDIKRPGTGIPPRFFEEIIGRKVKDDISKDSVLSWDDLE